MARTYSRHLLLLLVNFFIIFITGNAGKSTTLLPPLPTSSDDIPGWGTALIVMFALGFVAGFFFLWKKIAGKRAEEQLVNFNNSFRATEERQDGTRRILEQTESYDGPANTFTRTNSSINQKQITFPISNNSSNNYLTFS